ncbi:hypothetical protein [Paenibacillus senegalimassiliensis]|uniref:hypothetical protein n=1 Tax=Paenibacillus senegalimassiliensis TaxID=1737426 RepID=UPI00073F9897|nr:hypothetical protein [Paenibacillus senegalimassiliensis]
MKATPKIELLIEPTVNDVCGVISVAMAYHPGAEVEFMKKVHAALGRSIEAELNNKNTPNAE